MADLLPDEIVSDILGLLAVAELLVAERVCLRWWVCANKLWSLKQQLQVRSGVGLRQLSARLVTGPAQLQRLCIAHYFPAERLRQWLPVLAESTERLRAIELTDVSDCELDDDVLRAVARGWPQLEEVKLKYVTQSHLEQREYPLTPDLDIGLSQIFSSCARLRSVDLHLDRLPQPSLLHKLPVAQMQHLRLKAHFYRAEFFEDLFTALYEMSALESVSLSFIFDQHVTNWWPEHALLDFLQRLAKHAAHIQQLGLMFAEHFFRQTTPLWHYATTARHFPALTALDLSDNSGLETRDMQIIGLHCQQLSELNLSGAKLGTEQALDYLLGCSKLARLDIARAQFYDFDSRTYQPLSGLSVRSVSQMVSLRRLTMDGCVGVSPKSLYHVVSTLAKLGRLHSLSALQLPACNHDFLAALTAALNPNHVSTSSVCGRWLSILTDAALGETSPLLRDARGISADPTCKGIVVRPQSKDQIHVQLLV